MTRTFFVVLLFTLTSAALFSRNYGKILFSIGEVLRVHQWYFLDEGSESIKSTARYLARNGQYTILGDKYKAGVCETFGTVIVTKLSFKWILQIIKDDAPECSWIVIGSWKEELLDELPPIKSLVVFYEPKTNGARLTLVQKPCWKCMLLKKTLEVHDSSRHDLNSFFSISHDFLNDTIVDVSVGIFEDCDPVPIDDPFAIAQCYHLEIIEMASEKIRFRPNQVLPTISQYPFNFPNGSQGGLFLQLSERSIDMSASSAVVAKERFQFCDRVWPTFEFKAVIFIESEQNDIVWLLHFYPFNKHIWFAILGIFAAGSLSLILITSHLRYINSQRHLIILFPIFYTLQILCFQSLVKIPKLISSRIAYISLLLTAAMILPAYSGSIVSYLTMKEQYYPFTTVDEFISDGRFQILTRDLHFINTHIALTGMTNLTSLMLPKNEQVQETQDGFDKLCGEWIAFIIEDILFRPALQNYQCLITPTPVTYMKEYLSISVPKNFPLTEQLRIVNIQARSSGIQDNWEKFIIQAIRPMNVEKNFSPVTLFHAAPMFVLLLIFIALAWLILGFEVMHHKKTLQGNPVQWRKIFGNHD